jgi:hypothetical protein
MRPIYLASLPGVLLLAGHCRTLPRPGRRLAAGMLGLSLVLLPQLRINQLHFGQNTPLVLAKAPGQPPLYLRQLVWGTRAQRYETTLVPGWQGALFYLDPAGLRALPPAKGAFRSYADYLQFVARQPLAVGGRYIRHLFNGLDVQFASPYVRALDSPGRLPLRLLNYLLLAVGGGLLLQCCRRLMPQPGPGLGWASGWPWPCPACWLCLRSSSAGFCCPCICCCSRWWPGPGSRGSGGSSCARWAGGQLPCYCWCCGWARAGLCRRIPPGSWPAPAPW